MIVREYIIGHNGQGVMGAIRQSFWWNWTAQAAVLLLALQFTLGMACPHRHAFLDPFSSGFLCAVNAPVEDGTAPPQTPAHDPSANCPICKVFCHAAVVLVTELAVSAPDGALMLAHDPAPLVVDVRSYTPHNRGPPAVNLA